MQCCGSKYIEFGSGSRILAYFGMWIRIRIQVRIRIHGYAINFERKIKIIVEKNNFCYKSRKVPLFLKNKMSPKETFSQLIYILYLLSLF